MIPLNVSFGIFAFLPQGWIFMIFVMFMESILISLIIKRKWNSRFAYQTAFISNTISGIIGFIVSMALNGGWWLVVWFPWVSDNEVSLSDNESLQHLAIYYACAFLLTLLIESVVNYFCLRKSEPTRKILTTTVFVNVISYVVGSVVLYSYSFG